MSDILKGATARPWQLNYFVRAGGEKIETVEHVIECLTASAVQGNAELHGCSIPGDGEPVICYTGNGPTSAKNARLIVTAVNAYEPMLAALEEVKQACLFGDDDGGIGVSEEPYISAALFAEICRLTKEQQS